MIGYVKKKYEKTKPEWIMIGYGYCCLLRGRLNFEYSTFITLIGNDVC